VGLVGAMLKDLAVTNYRPEDSRWKSHRDKALAIFDSEASCTLDFATRLAAADAIGQGHDPRLDGDNWIRIKGGKFCLGAQRTDPKNPNFEPEYGKEPSPVQRKTVKTFEIAKYPVTVREYESFLSANYGREKPRKWREQLRYPNRPVVGVSWHDASAYADSKGCRLITEAQWEYVAKNGSAGTKYPWGNEPPDGKRANSVGHLTPVGLYPEGATSTGVHDMVGNVTQWTADSPNGGVERWLRGSAYGDPRGFLHVSFRFSTEPNHLSSFVGFRLARDVPS
jgi:sulfatase modifying factor 1